jgi:hypothetical protein
MSVVEMSVVEMSVVEMSVVEMSVVEMRLTNNSAFLLSAKKITLKNYRSSPVWGTASVSKST